ncbi:non-hydrolyzing UDP-N-acetylglucosamine 2-epimerase [Halapricum desulfuricans]|uniref:UDP-N-acetylglucosamine 2-epimerase n=1 Tax=Halapricum desulfuricans TaxID=2841257 RepID=A0A897N9R0_9EURY|nr:UDP-N-acetylglucosamine 2-epimerase (non-hydrolyzing) [Halapricum desulfuricans]QSG07749.1 UDP-N-acetylglucosamine 2-epimerase [Halapricum desulfuricans]
MKVLTVVGARPQFVKAFPVSEQLSRHEEVLVHTGQHYDEMLSSVFFEELPIPEPSYNLGVGSGSHAVQTAQVMERLDDVVDEEAPDVVLVYGDTNSTLGAGLVAAKRPVRLVHVEAGVRSGDWSMPEEVNRVVVDQCADLLCAPTDRAAETLRAGDVRGEVVVTGDVMYDALLAVREHALAHSTIVDDLGLTGEPYVLATVHRERNTDAEDRLRSIVEGLASVSATVVLPAHPRTVAALEEYGLHEEAASALELVDPVGYLDFVALLSGAERVATDSGGVQKEAFYLDRPCVTLRETTEWPETVEAGWNVLVDADPAAIRTALTRPRPNPEAKPTLYGGGEAAERVVRALSHPPAAMADDD